MASKKKFNIVSIVVLAVLGVALIMGIVGLCIDWLSVSFEGESELAKLKDLIDANKEAKDLTGILGMEAKVPYPGIEAAQAFGIIAVISAALTAVSFAVSKFVNVKALKFVTVGLAALLIVSALLTLILTFTCTTSDLCKAMKEEGVKFIPAAGCWLLSVFGIAGGAAGILGGIKG